MAKRPGVSRHGAGPAACAGNARAGESDERDVMRRVPGVAAVARPAR